VLNCLGISGNAGNKKGGHL